MRDWIEIHASLKEWEWYKTPNMLQMFLHLLLSASPDPYRHKGKEYASGTMVSTVAKLSMETGITVKSVRTCLQRLKQSGYIEIKGTNKFTIITICNFGNYATQKTTTGKQTANNGQTNGKQMASIIRCNTEVCNGIQALNADMSGKQAEKEKKKEKENSPHTPYKEKEINKEKEITPPPTNRVRAREFAEKFFSPLNQYNLQLFVEQLHRINDDIKIIEDIKPYVDDVMARWGLSDKTHYDYTDWSLHLQDTIRSMVTTNARNKKSKQNGTDGIQAYINEQQRIIAEQRRVV